MRAINDAKTSLWIATANVKDVHIEAPIGSRARARGTYRSIVEAFAEMATRGVDVRLLHGAVPSGPFRMQLTKLQKRLGPRFEMRHCPRVHLKLVAVDGAFMYLGSANLTGAGIGARGDRRRNFEMGIVTDDDVLLDRAQAQFDRIWRGRECGSCQLRSKCPKPLDMLTKGRPKRGVH